MSDLVLESLANRMLVKLGAQRLVSLDETGPAAASFNDVWATVRRHELRRYPWTFALTRTSVAADAVAPAWGWSLAYTVPGDSLRVWQVGPHAHDQPRHALEGGRVLTNEASPLTIRYVRDIAAPDLWDPVFFEVMAARLAFELCDRITGSPGRKQVLISEYASLVEDARRIDAIEGPLSKTVTASPWVDARSGGGDGFGCDKLVSPFPRPEPL